MLLKPVYVHICRIYVSCHSYLLCIIFPGLNQPGKFTITATSWHKEYQNVIIAFFSFLLVVGNVKMKLNISSLPLTVKNSLKRMMNMNLILFVRSHVRLTEAAADVLDTQQRGCLARISGENKEGFPHKEGFLYPIVCLLFIKEQTKENWKEETKVCLQMHSEYQPECSHLGFCKNNKRKDITALMDTCVSVVDFPRIWRIR